MTIRRFRRKPDPNQYEDQLAVRYYFGEPLDDLAQVAAHAADGEVAECVLPTETVLLVRWMGDYGPRLKWCYTVVHSGRWLGFSPLYGNLSENSEDDLAQWYEPVEET